MEKYLNPQTINLLKNAIGSNSLIYLNKSKVLFSSLVHKEKNNSILSNTNTKIILKNFENPFIEDWRIYMILRAYCNTQITTRNNLITEKGLNTYNDFEFLGDFNLEKYFYKANTEEELVFNKNNFTRNCFIFSNKIYLEDLMNLKFFSLKSYKKFVIENEILNQQKLNYGKERFEDFCLKNGIFFVNKKFENLKDVIFYCKNNLGIFENKIILETGVNAMKGFFGGFEYIESEYKSPIDFLFVSVYEGDIKEENLGENFANFEEIKNSGLVLVNISDEIKSERGFLRFYTFVNKRIFN